MCFKNILLSFVLVLAGSFGVAGVMSQGAMALPAGETCPAGTLQAGKSPKTYAECNVKPDETGGGLMTRSNTIINVIVGLVGIISVAVIVIGGISFATSQGDTAKTTKAKNTVLYGVVGLVVALLAFAIVNFVLKSVFAPREKAEVSSKEPLGALLAYEYASFPKNTLNLLIEVGD